jgi:hypothetical protein
VRVVHSWTWDTDQWDAPFEGHEHGWKAFFRILRLYLTHYRGLASSTIQLIGLAPEPKNAAWKALTSGLGLADAETGKRVRTSGDAPPLAGLVERVGPAEYPEELLLRLEEPAGGLAHLYAMSMGGQVYLPVRLFLFGDHAASAAASAEPLWQRWMHEHFPPG